MKKIKRITCIINSLGSGGAERVMSVLCNHFVQRGIDVTLIVRQSKDSVYYIDERVNVVDTAVFCKNKVIRNIKRNIKLRHEIAKSNPDVIISFMTSMNIQVIMYTLGLSYPIVISERNNPETDINFVNKILVKLLYPRCKGIVFQTEDAKSWFSKSLQDKSVVIPNPISDNLPERKPVCGGKIVSVGRLTTQKNQKMMIDAFSDALKGNDKYTLTIYGKGPLENQLKEYVSTIGLEGKVVFAGYCSNVPEAISDAEMFILPSDYEGMPNALIEAMGVGLPCISTDCPCGGPRFLIKNEENGVLVPVNDRDAMSSAIRKVLNDEAFAERIGNEAKKVRDVLNSEKVTEQWLDYCMNIVER